MTGYGGLSPIPDFGRTHTKRRHLKPAVIALLVAFAFSANLPAARVRQRAGSGPTSASGTASATSAGAEGHHDTALSLFKRVQEEGARQMAEDPENLGLRPAA